MTQPTEAPEDTTGTETDAPDPVQEWHALQELAQENLARRIEAAGAEIQSVLDKYGLKLHMTPPQFTLIPNS